MDYFPTKISFLFLFPPRATRLALHVIFDFITSKSGNRTNYLILQFSSAHDFMSPYSELYMHVYAAVI
jgi:hypothetical protein